MNRRDPAALRASLDARLQLLASERGVDVNRLRRHLTFQRILRRLGDEWVLKGGYLLETRLGAKARATKDLDLSLRETTAKLADSLAEALDNDPDDDGFVFRVSAPRSHRGDTDQLGGPGARLSVTAMLAGREFARARVDVVSRPGEIDGGVEPLVLTAVVAEPGWSTVTVQAVDLAQHTAEKLHALSAVNAHPRPSTRVKDLLDVVLIVESGDLDEAQLPARLTTVFRIRNSAEPLDHLPDPPAAWIVDYAAMAADYDVSATDLTHAIALARELYQRALTRIQETPDE